MDVSRSLASYPVGTRTLRIPLQGLLGLSGSRAPGWSGYLVAGDEQGRPNEEPGDGLRGRCHQEHGLLHGRGAAFGDHRHAGRCCHGRGRRWIWGQRSPPHRHGAWQPGVPETNPCRRQRARLKRGHRSVSLLPGERQRGQQPSRPPRPPSDYNWTLTTCVLAQPHCVSPRFVQQAPEHSLGFCLGPYCPIPTKKLQEASKTFTTLGPALLKPPQQLLTPLKYNLLSVQQPRTGQRLLVVLISLLPAAELLPCNHAGLWPPDLCLGCHTAPMGTSLGSLP